jgi:hypothetical protein
MADREQYAPRPKWTLILVRELLHLPADMFKRFASVRSLYG